MTFVFFLKIDIPQLITKNWCEYSRCLPQDQSFNAILGEYCIQRKDKAPHEAGLSSRKVGG